MSVPGKDFHIQSPTGAILTRFWPGGYKAAYSPLTHFVVAAKSPAGVVLVAPEGGRLWILPGGRADDKDDVLEAAKAKFSEHTGLDARLAAVLGYFRIVLDDSVEYGALIICACDAPGAAGTGTPPGELRTWNCRGPVEGLDPISAALAGAAFSSRGWRYEL